MRDRKSILRIGISAILQGERRDRCDSGYTNHDRCDRTPEEGARYDNHETNDDRHVPTETMQADPKLTIDQCSTRSNTHDQIRSRAWQKITHAHEEETQPHDDETASPCTNPDNS